MAFDYKKDYFRYKHYYLKTKEFYQKPVTKATVNLILSLFTISFFAFFAIRPTLKTIAKLNGQLETQK